KTPTGTGAAVGEDEWHWLGVVSGHVNEMGGMPSDCHAIVVEGGHGTFVLPPVVGRPPIGQQLFEVRQLGAVLPGIVPYFVRPAGTGQALAEINEGVLRHSHHKGLFGHRVAPFEVVSNGYR